MKEQEKLTIILKKIVNETENYKIESTDELIKVLVKDLSKEVLVATSN